MKKLIYIGPDLVFLFTQKQQGNGNGYHATVKSAGVKLDVEVDFNIVSVKNTANGATECSMGLKVVNIAGPGVTLEQLNKAINCLTVNSKLAGEVCCQAFLNDFLDTDF